MTRRSTPWLRTLAILALAALIGPVLTTNTMAQDGDKVLRVQYPDFTLTLDPQKSGNVFEISVLDLAYEGLTRLDTNQETVPAAAESWEYNNDATQITFHLREGLTYSDGSPLTAENFRYAVERTCDPQTAGSYQAILFGVAGCAELAGLGMDRDGNPQEYSDEEYDAATAALGVRVLDDRTLQIDLTDPASYFHTIAYTWVFYPVKQEIVEASPDTWWQSAENHIGNGPFTITGIADGERWDFTANEQYWQGRPKLDGIEYIAFDDPAAALAAYEAGDLDIMGVDSEIRPEIDADPTLSAQLLTYPQAGTFYLAMSLNQEPFTDAKVREAFAYAFDRDAFCAEVYPDTCEPARSWMPPGVPGQADSEAIAFDPEAAQEALAASSYGSAENLPEITASYFGEPGEEDIAEDAQWVADQYREILGIELVLEPVEGGELFAQTLDAETYPQFMIFNGWFQDYPDPQNWLSVVWNCDSTFAQAAGYCNEEFDRLTAIGDTTVDPAQRLEAYQQAERILIADAPGVFVYHPAGLVLIQPSVTGITPAPVDAVWPGGLTSLMTIEKTAPAAGVATPGTGTPSVS